MTDRERIAQLSEALARLIHPDNGRCNVCGGFWSYHTDGSRHFSEGVHSEWCPTNLLRGWSVTQNGNIATRPTPTEEPTHD